MFGNTNQVIQKFDTLVILSKMVIWTGWTGATSLFSYKFKIWIQGLACFTWTNFGCAVYDRYYVLWHSIVMAQERGTPVCRATGSPSVNLASIIITVTLTRAQGQLLQNHNIKTIRLGGRCIANWPPTWKEKLHCPVISPWKVRLLPQLPC